MKAVEEVNKKKGKVVFQLDIYGPVAEEYREKFEEIIANAPDYIQYCGSVEFDKTVEVLKTYYALIFPTEFYTEGIPGTIIDAYASGVPVISSRWESFADMVDENIVGLGYSFGVYEELVQCLLDVAERPEVLQKMKENCLQKANSFSASYVVGAFVEKGLRYE